MRRAESCRIRRSASSDGEPYVRTVIERHIALDDALGTLVYLITKWIGCYGIRKVPLGFFQSREYLGVAIAGKHHFG